MDTSDTLERQIAGIAALHEPMRRSLYLYVSDHGGDVSRDEAAAALGIGRALAAFHLDKLVDEGLLEPRYRRLTGRSGPGAGRPTKLYRRANRQFAVSLPPRSYELAARLFAHSLAQSRSPEVLRALKDVAREFGAGIGAEARALAPADASSEYLLEAAETLLAAYGFEPHRAESGEIRLRNCPFHALSSEYRELVCGMNLSLMRGVVDGLQAAGVQAVLDPQPGMCCVAFRPITLSSVSTSH